MLNETLGKSYAEQHFECNDLYAWCMRARCDRGSSALSGFLTVDDLFECYRKFSLSRGLIPQIGTFTQIKDAALSFFAAGMGSEMLDEDSTCGGGSFNQECWQKGFFKAAERWGVDSEKPKLSIYFSITRNTMSNERVPRTIERQNTTPVPS